MPLGWMRRAGGLALFAAVGVAAVVVGSFMIRGAMHLWDRKQSKG